MAWVLQSDDRARVDNVAHRAFRNFGKFVIDFIHFPTMTREEVRRRLVFDQWVELDEVANSGRGAIIVTMHFGIWDLGAAALAAYDYKINAVGDNYGYSRMDAIIHDSRRKLGVTIFPVDRAAFSAVRAIKRGEMLAMLIDVPSQDDAIVVDFLGAPAEVSSAPARLALRTGAWVVPAVVLRGPERDTIIRPHLDVRGAGYQSTGDEEADVRELTQRIMRSFEPHIRAHPEQWYIFRPMWPGTSPFEGATAVPAELRQRA
jgi:KDO2-lipid IV(A) lauroyltransferase